MIKKKIISIMSFMMLLSTLFIFGQVPVSSEETATIVLNCGSITIDGWGSNYSISVTCYDHEDVDIDENGELVRFKVHYDINDIDGAMDCAWARLIYNAITMDSKMKDTGSADGWLYYEKFCYSDDHVNIKLQGEYADLIGLPYLEWHAYCNCTSFNSFLYTPPENHAPNEPEKPGGDDLIYIGLGYIIPSSVQAWYSTSATDPDGDDVSIFIDFGNGDTSGWIGQVLSGQTVSDSTYWDEVGTYYVKARAKDHPPHQGQEQKYSGWSPSLEVNVKWWWQYWSNYCEADAFELAETTYTVAIQPTLPQEFQSSFNSSSMEYHGFFLDNNNDSIYDELCLVRYTDGDLEYQDPMMFNVSYDETYETYAVDFDDNGMVSIGEAISGVAASSLETCVDGNPLDGIEEL